MEVITSGLGFQAALLQAGWQLMHDIHNLFLSGLLL
jgi:hypothetical protein